MLASSICWGFWFCEEFKDTFVCIFWGRTWTLSQGSTIVSWLFLSCLCIPSLSCLATVRICPLELGVVHGGHSLFPTNKKQGARKGFWLRSPTGCSHSSLEPSIAYLPSSSFAFGMWVSALHREGGRGCFLCVMSILSSTMDITWGFVSIIVILKCLYIMLLLFLS